MSRQRVLGCLLSTRLPRTSCYVVYVDTCFPTLEARFTWEVNKISLIDLISMSKVVKGFKYQQIGYLEKLFVRRGLRPFQLAVVRYADGTETIVTPAVVEAAGTRQVLIQGNTRATYCYKKRIEEIDCVMVRNVSVPLPSNQRIPVEHMLIGDRTLTVHDRYGADIDRDYRQIELASHHPEVTLR